jgi:hypothetical protein
MNPESAMNHRYVLRGFVLSLLLAAGLPTLAQVSINIQIAPPALRYEPVPAMAPGYVWAPGYWAWHDDRHIWVRGRTIVQRTGYRWEPERWEQRGNTYYQQAGRWAPDANYRPIKEPKAQKPKHNNGRQHEAPGHNKGDKPGKGPKQDR